MSDLSHSFRPWEDNFSKGLYLAGVECADDAEAPEGWVKWIIPGYEYIFVENMGENVFSDVIDYLKQEQIPLAGAAHDFTCPVTGKIIWLFQSEQFNEFQSEKEESMKQGFTKAILGVAVADEAHRGQYELTEKVDAETGKIKVGTARIIRDSQNNTGQPE